MEEVIRLLQLLHKTSHYGRIKCSPHMGAMALARLQSSINGFVRVAEHDGKITGVLMGLVDEYWWAEPKKGARYASDLAFFSRRLGDGARMMREFIDWAWSRPRVVKVETAVSSGMLNADLADRFYENLGFEKRGSLYVIDHPKLRKQP